MRIAMIISTPFPPEEGIGFYVYNLSKNLIKRGHEVSVLTRGGLKYENYCFEDINVIKAPFLPLYPFHVYIHGFFLQKQFNKLENKFDLVHIHTPLSPVINTELPIVGTIHTSVIGDAEHLETFNMDTLLWKLTTNFSSRHITQKLINKANIVTTVSSSVKDELIKYYKRSSPLVVGNGVNENVFHPVKQKNQDPYVLYVARLDYRKGVLDLIETAKLIQDYDIKMMVAGDGPLKKHFHNEIVKNNLAHVELLGHVSGKNLVNLYQNALMFVFPSLYEGLPTVLLEAMACGLPVIATEIPAHKDLIKNMKNGIFIKPKSPEELAKKILILKENKDLRKKVGKNARKTIEKRFTWDKVSKNYERLYTSI